MCRGRQYPATTKLAEVKTQLRPDRKAVAIAFGKALRSARERLGVSQEQLALLARVDRTFVSKAERGLNQPALCTVILLARALDMPASQLIAEVESTVERTSP